MRLRARADRNQPEIVKALRNIGCSVACTHQIGGGFPDLVVSKNGVNLLLEIKDPKQPPNERVLTLDQMNFQHNWRGQYAVVLTVEDAIKIVREHTK